MMNAVCSHHRSLSPRLTMIFLSLWGHFLSAGTYSWGVCYFSFSTCWAWGRWLGQLFNGIWMWKCVAVASWAAGKSLKSVFKHRHREISPRYNGNVGCCVVEFLEISANNPKMNTGWMIMSIKRTVKELIQILTSWWRPRTTKVI